MFVKKSSLIGLFIGLVLHTTSWAVVDDTLTENDAVQEVYFYIPVSCFPNSRGIEHQVSKPVYKDAGVQLLHMNSRYG